MKASTRWFYAARALPIVSRPSWLKASASMLLNRPQYIIRGYVHPRLISTSTSTLHASPQPCLQIFCHHLHMHSSVDPSKPLWPFTPINKQCMTRQLSDQRITSSNKQTEAQQDQCSRQQVPRPAGMHIRLFFIRYTFSGGRAPS